jgi:hypothetical protein
MASSVPDNLLIRNDRLEDQSTLSQSHGEGMSILSRLLRKAAGGRSHAPTVLVPIPPLLTILSELEQQKGGPPAKEEVQAARDNAVCMAMPLPRAIALVEARGYEDIDTASVWPEWQEYRSQAGNRV